MRNSRAGVPPHTVISPQAMKGKPWFEMSCPGSTTASSTCRARGPATADAARNLATFLGLANRGVQLSMRGIGALSTPMQEHHIDTLVDAFADLVDELRADGLV